MSIIFFFLAGILSLILIGYAAQTLRTGAGRDDSAAVDVALGIGAATSLVALVVWLTKLDVSAALAVILLLVAAAVGGAAAFGLRKQSDSPTGIKARAATVAVLVAAATWGYRGYVYIELHGLIRFLLQVLAAGVILGLLYVVVTLVVSAVDVVRQRRYDKRAGKLAPFYRDGKVLALFAQLIFLLGAGSVIAFLIYNFDVRTSNIGLTLNFDFLDSPFSTKIPDNPLQKGTVQQTIEAGLGNTIRLIIVGIPLSIALGTLIGIARLSSNWLLRKIATGYVEFFRNLPPVLIIIFMGTGVYLSVLPKPSETWKPLNGWFILNNLRFGFPSLVGLNNWDTYRWVLLAGVLAAIAVGAWRTRVFITTGHPHHRILWGLGTFVGIAVVGYVVLGRPLGFSKPEIPAAGGVFPDGPYAGQQYGGGIFMLVSYAALTSGLVLYTASHIAEIVRGSILAVDRGQVEASEAIALNGFQRYRFVILPQAMRIAFPALINQFLNYTKNTSLALAIGFKEVTSVIQNMNGSSLPAPQLILILMLLYLTLSLLLSAIGNTINRRLQIVGR